MTICRAMIRMRNSSHISKAFFQSGVELSIASDDDGRHWLLIRPGTNTGSPAALWPAARSQVSGQGVDMAVVLSKRGFRPDSARRQPHGRMGAMAERLRVMLVDDHEVVRSGIKALLQAHQDLSVVAEAGSVTEAVSEAARARPDVIVMDVRLADGSGIEATREIRAQRPETQVLMLTSFADDEALFASIMAGAAGYVLKQIRGGELVQAIRAVGQGQSLLDPAVTASVLDRLRKGKHLLKDEKLARLSGQEERILSLVAEGHTNREIGSRLKLAEKTVKNYVSAILSKLDVARRAEAAAYLARDTSMLGS
jgi:DNA-binding NarL/FixJ family response regulator